MRLVTNIKTNKDIGHKNRTPCSLKMVHVIFFTITLLRIEGADSKKFVNFVV